MEHLKNILHIEIINEQKTILFREQRSPEDGWQLVSKLSRAPWQWGAPFPGCLFKGLKYLVSSEDTPISDNDNLAWAVDSFVNQNLEITRSSIININ